MSFRVFITGSGIVDEAQELLRQAECAFTTGDPADTAEQIAAKVRQFQPHALIVRQGKITAEVMDASPHLRVICKHGVGVDNIDLAAATARNLPVLRTVGANFESVAEHTLGLILALARRIPEQDRRIRDGVFDKRGYRAVELRGRVLGLVGFGRIARRVAELVAPFQMRVVAFHPSRTREALPLYITKAATLETVLEQADILSLHCPLSEETRGLIDAAALRRMKPGSLLVNTARGAIVRTDDLIDALREGRIAGAALDVFEDEPLPADHPLCSLPNVILTPHVAGVSDASLRNMGIEAVRHVLTVLRGEEIDAGSLVNPQALQAKR